MTTIESPCLTWLPWDAFYKERLKTDVKMSKELLFYKNF